MQNPTKVTSCRTLKDLFEEKPDLKKKIEDCLAQSNIAAVQTGSETMESSLSKRARLTDVSPDPVDTPTPLSSRWKP